MGNTQSDAVAVPAPACVLDKLEQRSRDAEAKIRELERRLEEATAAKPSGAPVTAGAPVASGAPVTAGAPPTPVSAGVSSAQLTSVYVNELKCLRDVLVAAEKEHQELLNKVSALEATNAKLEYRIMHLKRNCVSEGA